MTKIRSAMKVRQIASALAAARGVEFNARQAVSNRLALVLGVALGSVGERWLGWAGVAVLLVPVAISTGRWFRRWTQIAHG